VNRLDINRIQFENALDVKYTYYCIKSASTLDHVWGNFTNSKAFISLTETSSDYEAIVAEILVEHKNTEVYITLIRTMLRPTAKQIRNIQFREKLMLNFEL
jgi:hypothetical protein